MIDSIVLYANGSAGNHGCEAITRSLCKIIGNTTPILLASYNKEEDLKYGINDIVTLTSLRNDITKESLGYMLYIILQHFFPSDKRYFKRLFSKFLKKVNRNSLYLSVGGDNYSYGNNTWLSVLNDGIHKKGAKSILLGCSVLDRITDSKMVEDLSKYEVIIARESITYNALLKANICSEIHCIPDPAFLLEKKFVSLPDGLKEKHFVTVNISPMVIEHEVSPEVSIKNYEILIKYILENTSLDVVLLPHVVWEVNDDRKPLSLLYNKFSNSRRVYNIEDCKAEELKYIISKSKFVVTARTHASIAAYSESVPTLVVGYSVKAKGIAMDIFGTYENYVIPVQNLNTDDTLCKKFIWLQENEQEILKRYRAIMPSYKQRVWKIREIIEKKRK